MIHRYMSTPGNTAKLETAHRQHKEVRPWLEANLQCISQHTTESSFYLLCQPAINDMHLCSDLDFIHFADVSTVYKSGHCVNDLCVYFNHELSKVDKWLCANKLSLNTNKSTFCVFTNRY